MAKNTKSKNGVKNDNYSSAYEMDRTGNTYEEENKSKNGYKQDGNTRDCHKNKAEDTSDISSRDYVIFGNAQSAARKFLNCLMICGHSPWSAPNLERHGSSKMQTFGWLEIPHFLNRISICIST